MPEKFGWKVYLHLMADQAKKEFKDEDARVLYRVAIMSQPFAHQVWLEYAKKEKEDGLFEKSLDILLLGLKFNPNDNNLFSEAIKIMERLNMIEQARLMITDIMKDYGTPSSAKILLEGAMFEGRQGNRQGARDIFEFLLQQ